MVISYGSDDWSGRDCTFLYGAEDIVAGIPGSVQVAVLALWLYINSRLENIDIKFAVGLHPAADVLAQPVFKLLLILPLQDDLTQLQKKNLIHGNTFPFVDFFIIIPQIPPRVYENFLPVRFAKECYDQPLRWRLLFFG